MNGLREMFVSIVFKDEATKAIQNVHKTMDDTTKVFKTSRTTATSTSKTIKTLSDTYKNVDKSASSTISAVKTSSDAIKKVGNSIKETTNRFKSFISQGNGVQSAINGVSRTTQSLRSTLNSARGSLTNFGSSAVSSFNSVASSAVSIAGAIGILQTFNSAINLVKNSVSSAFDRIDVMENFQSTMTVLTGSADKAKAALDATNEAVTGTAYGLDVAAKSVQNFVTRGMEVDKATETIRAWGDAVAFYGNGSNEQLETVADALGKMYSSGKVQGDELNRLFDVGINAVGMYAKAVGRNEADVRKALSDGKISAEEFIDTVGKAMMEGTNGVQKIAGAAKDGGATWSATFANMRAAITRGTQSMIQSIDSALVASGLPDMRTMISNFGKSFENTLKGAASVIPVVIKPLKGLYDTLKPTFDNMKTMYSEAFANVADVLPPVSKVFDGAREIFSGFVDSVKTHFPSMKDTYFNALESIIPITQNVGNILKDVGTVVMSLVNRIVVPLIPVIYEIVSNVFTAIRPVIQVVTNVIGTLKDVILFLVNNVVSPLVPVIGEIFGKVFGIVNPILRIASSLFSGLWEVVKFLVENIVMPLIPVISKEIGKMWDFVKPILDTLITVFEGIADAIEWAVGKFKDFTSAVSNFKMPKIGLPKWMGGEGLIQLPGHATGLARVPYDDYPMMAHKDEAVLTAEQANALRAAGMLRSKSDGTPELNIESPNFAQPSTNKNENNYISNYNNTSPFNVNVPINITLGVQRTDARKLEKTIKSILPIEVQKIIEKILIGEIEAMEG